MATKPWNTLSVKQCHLMNIYKESSNNVIFCNRTLEDFHGNPEIQKWPLCKNICKAPLNNLTNLGHLRVPMSMSRAISRIFVSTKNPADGSAHAQWNSQMSKVPEVVEWGFANILAQWSFLDFRVAMKIFQSPVAKYYIVTALFVNIWTCFYGNQTMEYLKCEAMSLDEYLSMID